MTNTTPAAADKLTVSALKAWARTNRSLATAALKARAFAEVERARVDAYIAPIFASYGFTSARTGVPITDARRLHHCGDEGRVMAYYEACDVAHRAHGYEGEPGTCPALVAAELQRQAENLLLGSLAAFVGVEGFARTLEMRAKALDLAISACRAA